MEISSISSYAAATGTIGVETRKETAELVQENTQTLIESVPDADASLGQNIDVKA